MFDQKSILSIIQDAINKDGYLPKNFCLPDEDKSSKVKFAPGALDGIIMYHSIGSSDQETPERLLLKEALEIATNGDKTKAIKKVHEYAKSGKALSDIDYIQDEIYTHQDSLDTQKIFELAYNLISQGTLIEAVKIGMSIMEIFDTEQVPDLREIIRLLASYDEFTLFGSFIIMSDWSDPDEELFTLVKKVRGWGRVHIIERINANTQEIKDWLLINGVDNDILPNYSALTCFEKADVRNLLDESLSLEQFRGCSAILEAMLEEQPMPGLSALEDGEALLEKFLSLLIMRSDLTDDDKKIIAKIKDYASEQYDASGKLNTYLASI